MQNKPSNRHGKFILIAVCIDLGIVIYDTILSYLFLSLGIYRFFHHLIQPNIPYYYVTRGIVSIALIPVTIILGGINLYLHHHEKENRYHKISLGICLLTLVYQFFILLIAIHNNN